MQIPGITNFVTSRVDYFLQSSWKGKTVQVLCAASILALIYCIMFRKKTPPNDGLSTSSPVELIRSLLLSQKNQFTLNSGYVAQASPPKNANVVILAITMSNATPAMTEAPVITSPPGET